MSDDLMVRDTRILVRYLRGETLQSIADDFDMTKEGARRCALRVAAQASSIDPLLPDDLPSLRIEKEKVFQALSIDYPAPVDESFYATLGKRIFLIRKEQKISQIQMASIMGMSQKGWSKYELGKSRIPIDLLLVFCKQTGSYIEDILEGLEPTLDH